MTDFRSLFLIYAFNAINFPTTTAFVAFHKILISCILIFIQLKIALNFLLIHFSTQVLFRSVISNYWGIFTPSLCYCFPNSQWSKRRSCIIIIILNLLRRVLWFRIWTILVNVLCETEKNVYSVVIGLCIMIVSS